MNKFEAQEFSLTTPVILSVALHLVGAWLFISNIQNITVRWPSTPMEVTITTPPTPQVLPPAPHHTTPRELKNKTVEQHQSLAVPINPSIPPRTVPIATPAAISIKEPALSATGLTQSKEQPHPQGNTTLPSAVTPRPSGTTTSGSALSNTGTIGDIVGPSFGAAYLHNPTPSYPTAAKKLRLQGTTIVRVFVSPEGQPKSVALEKTSGVKILDDAAVEAVTHWSFVPARRGNEHISAWVNVPIKFRLNSE